MKKTGLLVLLLATAVAAQQGAPLAAGTPDSSGIVPTSVSVPTVRYQTPTPADLYCAGFLTSQSVPNANFVDGGLQTPSTTKFSNGEMVYLAGTGYQAGQQYTILRELRDVNGNELYPGQKKLVASVGRPYADIGRVRVLDTRSHSAVAQVEFSCDPINPGDIAVPFVEKQPIAFHAPAHFDRFAPSSNKLSGRIVLGKDFAESPYAAPPFKLLSKLVAALGVVYIFTLPAPPGAVNSASTMPTRRSRQSRPSE